MVYNIERINNSTLLPGIKLGYEIHDSCTDVAAAVQATMGFLSKFNSSDKGVAVLCNYTDYVPAAKIIVGGLYSEISIVVARILNLYLIPQISYISSAEILSDKIKFASFFRAVPSDKHQTSAIAQLIRHLRWNWVGVIATEDDYGQSAMNSFILHAQKNNICVDFRLLIPVVNSKEQDIKINETAQKIQNSTAQLLNELKNVRFLTENGNFQFDSSGDYSSGYDIINWRWVNNSMQFNKVGDYNITTRLITIHADFEKIAQVGSFRCSYTCKPGERKTVSPENNCCYNCSTCSPGTYSEKNDSIECLNCTKDYWSDAGSSTCQKSTVDFLQWGDALSLVLIIVAILGILIVGFVSILVTKYLSTPAVKAAGGWMCYLMLFSLVVCLVSSILFIGKPHDLICKIRQPLFSISFTLCASCILVKSFRIILAFSFDPIIRKNLRLFYKPVPVIIITTGVQVIICSLWLSLSPPKMFKNRDHSKLILLLCNEGSHMAFGIMLGYIALLACICFILAFKGRKAPKMYNEARFITFSMLVYLIVWISFGVVYINMETSKYLSIIESIAILASVYSFLCCHFFPTCYVVCFKKESNIESNYLTHAREHFKQKGQFVLPIAKMQRISQISTEEQTSSPKANLENECPINQKTDLIFQNNRFQNQRVSNCLRKRHKSC
ncbi:G-protein coupled receptor family C group 6 member A-like [Pristis pectinata]|uniref:G-protein coupled receptor family C group 6 member A-like n=1 Tax=Pristis pectinata TaxID=685728 RepID=UPI00223E2518|nr:G-protein coupled receptor family C group 6 member A-like [Pristis pectinata]